MAEPNFSDVFEAETTSSAPLEEDRETVSESENQKDVAENRIDPARSSAEDSRKVKDGDAPGYSAELEAVRREARVSAERETDELFRDVGMVNPYTNEVIRSKADFLAWKKRFQEDSAAAAAENQKAGPEPGKAERDARKRVEQTVARELAKIQRWDDEIKNLEDIADSENFAAVYERVMRGYDLSDAVYLANADLYRRRAADRAEQAAINRLRSKEHLVGVRARGGSETVVPRDVMAEFKRLMPKASGEEIRKFYRRDQAHLKK